MKGGFTQEASFFVSLFWSVSTARVTSDGEDATFGASCVNPAANREETCH